MALLAAAALPQAASAVSPSDAVAEAEWILTLRVTSGPDLGLIDLAPGQNYCIPYFSNVAASGLAAASAATGDPRYVRAAWDWLDWYARHMDPSTGFISNHRFDGARWVADGRMDSTDSYAATFLIALRDAWLASGDDGRLQALWPAVRKAVDAMIATDNGAWMTYAKPNYPHAFVMDNVEVYEAFRIVEHLAGTIVPDPALRYVAGRWAANMPAAFENYWNADRHGYDIAIGSQGERFLVDYATLYPGATAQSWMLRTGLVSPSRATDLVTRIEQAHPVWERSGEQPQTAWFPEIVEGMRFAGRSQRAEQALTTMVGAIRAAGRAWPYHAGTAGRIIPLLAGDADTLVTSAPNAYVFPGTTAFSFAGVPGIRTGGTVTFECSLDGVPFVACTQQHSVPALVEGLHVLRVRVRDAAGVDATPASFPWTVDATAPSPRLTSTPSEPGNATPSFGFDATDASPLALLAFECAVDGALLATCRSPAAMQVSGTGTHTFRLRARDPAGNVSPLLQHSWFADGTLPETTIISGPPPTQPVGDATFVFGGSDDRSGIRFECRVGMGSFSPCASPIGVSMGEGSWIFQVRTVDAVGNADPSPASRSFTVDRTPPSTVLLERPPPVWAHTSARFVFTGSDNVAGPLRFDCSLDGVAFTRCTTPHTVGPLAAGAHVFEVRAVDVAGYVDPTPARAEWVIDVAAPRGAFTTLDSSVVASAEPLLRREVAGSATDDISGIDAITVRFTPVEFTGEPVSVQATITCADAERRSCSWTAPAPIPSGRYRVAATITDRAGNEGAAQPSQIVVYVI